MANETDDIKMSCQCPIYSNQSKTQNQTCKKCLKVLQEDDPNRYTKKITLYLSEDNIETLLNTGRLHLRTYDEHITLHNPHTRK